MGRWLLAALLAATAASAQPQPQPKSNAIQGDAIAKAAGHPGPLRVEPESTSELAKGFGTPLWAVGIDSADGSFGHVSALLVHRRTYLTEPLEKSLAAAAEKPTETAAAIRADLESQIKTAHDERERTRLQHQLAEVEAVTAKNPITQKLTLPNGIVGYGTMLGFSAGGATFVTAFPSPDDQFEVVVATGASLEGESRKPNEKSADYERAMRDHPLQVSEAIAQVIYLQLYPPEKPTEVPKKK